MAVPKGGPNPPYEGRWQWELNGVHGGIQGVELCYGAGGACARVGEGKGFCVVFQGLVKGQSS